jgi:hypothetical protein
MRAFDCFLFIVVAPLKLNKNKISKAQYITNISEKIPKSDYSTYSKVFIPPFIRAVNSLFSLIPSKPSGKILEFHKKCIILFQNIYLGLPFITRFFRKLEYKILSTGSSENFQRPIASFYLVFACIIQMP